MIQLFDRMFDGRQIYQTRPNTIKHDQTRLNERVSISTVPPSASAISSGGARSLSLKFKTRSKTVGYPVHGGTKSSSIR